MSFLIQLPPKSPNSNNNNYSLFNEHEHCWRRIGDGRTSSLKNLMLIVSYLTSNTTIVSSFFFSFFFEKKMHKIPNRVKKYTGDKIFRQAAILLSPQASKEYTKFEIQEQCAGTHVLSFFSGYPEAADAQGIGNLMDDASCKMQVEANCENTVQDENKIFINKWNSIHKPSSKSICNGKR